MNRCRDCDVEVDGVTMLRCLACWKLQDGGYRARSAWCAGCKQSGHSSRECPTHPMSPAELLARMVTHAAR